jgi:adenosine deaminase
VAIGSLAEQIPKIHLHCHLEGSLRAATFIELAAKHGVPMRYRPSTSPARSAVLSEARSAKSKGQGDNAREGDKGPYDFKDFQEFLYIFAAVSRSLREPQDYARLAREFVEDALAQGVMYGELFVSPPVWTFFNPELDVRATMQAISAELRRARPRATFTLLPDLTRNFGPENALKTARSMAAMIELDVVGVSLGGDEARHPARLFVEAFEFARASGLHCVAHAGEADGPASVRDAVELLRVERIGHGVRALEDAATVEMLAERGIPLEICPTSNRLTGTVVAGHPHPFLALDRSGCSVTIDCDDPAIFNASLAREYELVEGVAGAAGLERFVRNAVDATFASDGEKRAMHARITAAVAELRGAPRS